MVYKVNSNFVNPLVAYLDKCIHSTDEFEGKILLDNNTSIIFNNLTRFKVINDKYLKLTNPDACIRISSITGVCLE